MTSLRNRYRIFTASQWHEFEQQALIYKYMMSGVPIPQDLISTFKRSHSSMLLRFLPQQPIGRTNLEMGFGRKADPEPGRCRRTDGKKWRCSKESQPDSKYCERHMHRGRNRSRKPVEVIASTNSSTTAAAIASLSFAKNRPFFYAHSSCRPPQNNPSHHLLLDSGSYFHTEKYSFTPLTRTFWREEERQKPFHHFIGENQLTISMPPPTQGLFGSNSTFHTGKS